MELAERLVRVNTNPRGEKPIENTTQENVNVTVKEIDVMPSKIWCHF